MRARAPRPAVRLLIGAALAAALAASLAAGAASRAEARSEKAEQTQDPPPQVFRGGGTTVVVPTTVFTRAGLPEMTLEQDDFRLFDEGRRQTITQFIRSEEPLTAVLLVDTSASMTVGLDQARHLVEQLVVRMRPGDRARVGSFSDKLILHRTFTSDRDSLLTTIRQDLHIGNPTRLLDAVDNAISTLVTEPGRRVILLVTDGCDTASQTAWGRVLDRIRIEEVMVYALQIRTRVNILPENRNRRVWDCVSLEQQFMTAETITSFKDVFQDARVALRPDVVLDQLTTETGGSRFIPSRATTSTRSRRSSWTRCARCICSASCPRSSTASSTRFASRSTGWRRSCASSGTGRRTWPPRRAVARSAKAGRDRQASGIRH
jgi:VWFA-related protein